MKPTAKKYCYICTYSLPSNSFLRRLCIKNISLDVDESIQIFIDDTYELLTKVDRARKLNQFIYKIDREEKIDRNIFKYEALDKIITSLKCLQFAFVGLQKQNQRAYTSLVKDSYQTWNDSNQPLIELLNYETGEKESLIEILIDLSMSTSSTFSLLERHLSLEDIRKVLKARQEISIHINIDEYIERFLSIENLSTDPVLHLITLYSLYEYIRGSNGSDLDKYFKMVNKNNSNTNLAKVFASTRHLVAHGFAGGKGTLEINTAEILKEFLGDSDSIGRYSFNRYNSKHINLINEVIGESQAVIEKYLKKKLKIGL